MSVGLYIGVGGSPDMIHPQHHEVMSRFNVKWLYVDKYLDHPNIVKWDAVDLQIEDNSVDVIYNSHLLEHIPYVQTKQTLKHWHSKLKEGGKLIINVPDLEWACSEFTRLLKLEREGKQNEFVNNHYRSTGAWGAPDTSFLQIFYGSQANDGEYHKAGFTKESLTDALQATGFNSIEVNQVYEAHDMGCLVAEGTK